MPPRTTGHLAAVPAQAPEPSADLANLPSPRIVILGAGRGVAGSIPTALQSTGRGRVLDWLLAAFSALPNAKVCFVGGFRGDAVRAQFPAIDFVHNPDWKKTGPVASLSYANLNEPAETWVSYADVVYRSRVVSMLGGHQADVVLAVDRHWATRYANRTPLELASAEKVMLEGDRVTAIDTGLDPARASGEFCGLMRLSPAAAASVRDLALAGQLDPLATIPQLLAALMQRGHAVHAVDIDDDWAELDAPQDLARFVLGTKAESLERLRPLVRKGVIGDLVRLTHSDWTSQRVTWPAALAERFQRQKIIVRSSSHAEDSWQSSSAGAFTSIANVPSGDAEALERAINEVFASYPHVTPESQVLIQEMLEGVKVSGVVMTRTHAHGAPYYVLNFDGTTGRTDTVTSGEGHALRTVYLHRDGRLTPELHREVGHVVAAVAELEDLVGHDSLDVEFAVTADDVVHVLQVRPIVSRHKDLPVDDEGVAWCVQQATQLFTRLQTPTPFIVGDRTFLSVMSDWNPAEIVGTKPKRLAFSLYQSLITDDVWATQRAQNGYRDVRPAPLLVDVVGHPYVDVRATFNSFVPASLPDALAARLVNHYLARLEAEPELHDKVEFDILHTCLTFDFAARAEELRAAGFTDADAEALRAGLAEVTRYNVSTVHQHYDAVLQLTARRVRLDASALGPLELAGAYLDDARRYGTLPFAHLARSGFVAASLLRSLQRSGVLSPGEVDAFLRSVHTVSTLLQTDAHRVARGELAWDEFVRTYGHLRPGTYDITSPCYAAAAHEYLRPLVDTASEPPDVSFAWAEATRAALEQALARSSLGLDVASLEAFLRRAIAGREYAKFAFTRNLSAALECFARVGEAVGVDREALSHVRVEDLLALRGAPPVRAEAFLRQRAQEGREAYNLAQTVCLPGFVCQPSNFRCFEQHRAEPNFVTRAAVRAPVVTLDGPDTARGSLEGCLVLVPNADPGFDWLFGHRIAGLITMYGGVNSHMAIRAAEFGLPAAIGVGQLTYDELCGARFIELDCGARRIRALDAQ